MTHYWETSFAKPGRYGAVNCTSQASLHKLVLVNLPKMVKPEMLVDETGKCKSTGILGKMVLRAAQRLHMNVGDQNGTDPVRLLPRESEMPGVVKITGKVKTEGEKHTLGGK